MSRPRDLYKEIDEYDGTDDDFVQSYQTTLRITRMFAQRANGVKILAFCVRDRPKVFYDAFLAIMKGVGIHVITEVPEALDAAESRGIEIRAEDGGHWNEVGHRIVGETIAEELRRFLRTGDVRTEANS